jgi:hypothetical protein
MVGVRYSAPGPRAFAIRGLGQFASDVSEIALPDVRLFAGNSAIPSAKWSDGRARMESACRLGQGEPTSITAWQQSPAMGAGARAG